MFRCRFLFQWILTFILLGKLSCNSRLEFHIERVKHSENEFPRTNTFKYPINFTICIYDKERCDIFSKSVIQRKFRLRVVAQNLRLKEFRDVINVWVSVADVDYNGVDHIATFTAKFENINPKISYQKNMNVSPDQPSISLQVRVEAVCENSYYGSNCSQYCEMNHHQYACNRMTGIPECFDDKVAVRSRTSKSGYQCLCKPGWRGSNCDEKYSIPSTTPIKSTATSTAAPTTVEPSTTTRRLKSTTVSTTVTTTATTTAKTAATTTATTTVTTTATTTAKTTATTTAKTTATTSPITTQNMTSISSSQSSEPSPNQPNVYTTLSQTLTPRNTSIIHTSILDINNINLAGLTIPLTTIITIALLVLVIICMVFMMLLFRSHQIKHKKHPINVNGPVIYCPNQNPPLTFPSDNKLREDIGLPKQPRQSDEYISCIVDPSTDYSTPLCQTSAVQRRAELESEYEQIAEETVYKPAPFDNCTIQTEVNSSSQDNSVDNDEYLLPISNAQSC